jgi:cell division septation protein DedD
MLEERRQYPRLVPSTPLFVSLDDAKSGLLLDLCEGGLAVASLVPRNLDEVVSLAFDLPEGVGHIEAKAKIAWTRDSGHLTGVRFMDLDEVSQQQLSEWISAGTNLKPASSEDVEEPVFVTRSTYAQVDAIRREVRQESEPEPMVAAMNAAVAAPMPVPMSSSTAAVAETTGSLFPEPVEAIETPVEDKAGVEAHPQDALISEDTIASEGTIGLEGAMISEGASRAEWVEHVAHMEESSAATRSGGSNPDIQQLPPDADTVGWASDAVGWVTEVAERRSNLPEEIPVEEILIPGLEEPKRGRTGKSRHTIELVLAVVLLTWALVFLGYQMGSTGASRATHDVIVAKPTGAGTGAAKGDPARGGAVSGTGALGMSAEVFPEVGIGGTAASGSGAGMPAPRSSRAADVTAPSRSAGPVAKTTPAQRLPSGGAASTASVASAPNAGAAVPTTSMSSGVVLQVGAMKVENNATVLVQDLKKKKFQAFVYQHGKDNLYRVGVGPFGDTDSSSKVKSELEKNGYKTITSKWIRE